MYTGFSSMPSWAVECFNDMLKNGEQTRNDFDSVHHAEIFNLVIIGKPIVLSQSNLRGSIISGVCTTIMGADRVVISIAIPGIATGEIIMYGAHLVFHITY